MIFISLCLSGPKIKAGARWQGIHQGQAEYSAKIKCWRNGGTGSSVWNLTVLGRVYFIEFYHLSSSKLKRLSIPLTDAYAAPFSWKKYQCQLFLSSVVELLQEQFSNIFSAPLKETCCAGGRWGGHGEPWLGKGWPDPAGSRDPNQHPMAGSEFIPLPFQGQPQHFILFSLSSDLCISATFLLFTVRLVSIFVALPLPNSLSSPLPFPCPFLSPGNCI